MNLEQAARLVEAEAETLDDAVRICECCGFRHYENWEQHQARQELLAAAGKLRRWEKKLKALQASQSEPAPPPGSDAAAQ